MKNLLLNAVEELVVRANNELNELRQEVNNLANEGDRVNAVYNKRRYIVNLVNKVIILKDKFEVDFPDDKEEAKQLEKKAHIILIQLEDILNVAYNVGNDILEDEEDEDYVC